jgi:hypothetical protein
MSTAPELPALPEPDHDGYDSDAECGLGLFGRDQMRAYGAACAAAEREACAKLCDEKAVKVSSGDRWMHPVVVAEAIRARGAA